MQKGYNQLSKTPQANRFQSNWSEKARVIHSMWGRGLSLIPRLRKFMDCCARHYYPQWRRWVTNKRNHLYWYSSQSTILKALHSVLCILLTGTHPSHLWFDHTVEVCVPWMSIRLFYCFSDRKENWLVYILCKVTSSSNFKFFKSASHCFKAANLISLWT